MSNINRRTVLWFGNAAWILWTIALVLMLVDLGTVSLAFVIIGSIAATITWIVALLIAAQRQQWGWVVGIALTTYIGGFLYGLTRAEESV